MRHLPILLLCSFAVTLGSLTAQEPGTTQVDTKTAKLRKALATMGALPSVAFETKETRTNARTRLAFAIPVVGGAAQIRAPNAGPATKVQGVLLGDLLYHSCNDGRDQILVRGRRRIARQGDEWLAVKTGLCSGDATPFLVDPQGLFRLLRLGTWKVAHRSVSTKDEMPIQIFTLTFHGKTAKRMSLAGVAPPSTSLRARGRFAGQGPETKQVLDVAISVDPVKSHILGIRVHSYSYDPMISMLRQRMRMAGRGGQEEEEEEQDDQRDEPELDPTKLTYEKGLPVRKIRDMPKQSFEIEFSQFGKAKLPPLDDRAKKLLEG